MFEFLPADLLINVEMKEIRLITHQVADVIRRHARWNSTLVASFNPISLWELKMIELRITRGYIWSRRHPFPIRSRIFSSLLRADWYDPANDSYNPSLHRRFHSGGARVLAWELDFDRDMQQMVALRLGSVVTDSFQKMLKRKEEVAKNLS